MTGYDELIQLIHESGFPRPLLAYIKDFERLYAAAFEAGAEAQKKLGEALLDEAADNWRELGEEHVASAIEGVLTVSREAQLVKPEAA